ncbi:MAG: DUF429 domain-containing protein [Longimicrobiales bacterium]
MSQAFGVGIDGCPAGWCAVRLGADGSWDVRVFASVEETVAAWGDGSTSLIDIPIGLPEDTSSRECDRLARAYLGHRARSVFNPPTRAALSAEDWDEANRRNRAACGKGLSRQSWGIAPKIGEVDRFLRSEAAAPGVLREAHPEVMFTALNHGRPMIRSKRTAGGRSERLAVLDRHVAGAAGALDRAAAAFRRKDVAVDDVLDAMVMAVVALQHGHRLQSMPEEVPLDGVGLPCEIVRPRGDVASTRSPDPATGADGGGAPVMYGELAEWWPLLSAPEDYAAEAEIYTRELEGACAGAARSLLELGSGGGNNAFHMKAHFDHVTLVDLAPGMVEVSRRLNPRCDHVVGDMRSVRLGRVFDCVFVHDAVSYMTTGADLHALMQTVRAHCRPGGAVLVAPDWVRERFEPETGSGGHDGDGRALRYLEWTWDPDPDDSTFVTDYAFLLRHPDGRVEVRHDRHVEGLFSEALWLRLLEEAGFRAHARTVRHDGVDRDSVFFVGRRDEAP